MQLNHQRSFSENHRNCSPSELHGGSLFRTFNSYSFNFNGGLRKCHTGFCLLRTPSPRGKQFLWFLKIDLLRITFISSLIFKSNLLFFWMCLLRINLPNQCPNMIHVDAFDFSEWHSEEVISRDATFQEISWNQEIWDRKKELQETWNSVSRKKNYWSKRGKRFGKKENVSKFPY